MKSTKRDKFLAAAFEVLSRAGRSMHYTLIVSVAAKTGMLQVDNKNVQASMVAILGSDVRTNPHSCFVRDKPGVYALRVPSTSRRPQHPHSGQDSQARIDYLIRRTGLADGTAVLNKSVYLLGRLLDCGSEYGVCSISNLNGTSRVDVRISDLVEELGASVGQDADCSNIETNPEIKRRVGQLARRLPLGNPKIAVAVALFVLDLALDIVDSDSLLVIGSGNSTTRLSLKSTR